VTTANVQRCLLMAEDFHGILGYWIKEYQATPTDLAVVLATIHDVIWEMGAPKGDPQ